MKLEERAAKPADRVVSRAAEQKPDEDPDFPAYDHNEIAINVLTEQKPDEVFTIHKRDKAYVLTFPHGSNSGTVTRDKL